MPARPKSVEAPSEESVLPPGRRDRSGFWLPVAYGDARSLVRRRRRGAPGATPEPEPEAAETA